MDRHGHWPAQVAGRPGPGGGSSGTGGLGVDAVSGQVFRHRFAVIAAWVLVPVGLGTLSQAAASFGALTAFFQWGWGTDVFGLGQGRPLEAFLPVVRLAILFGLSMDSQVLLVSRMNEEWGTRTATRQPSAPAR